MVLTRLSFALFVLLVLLRSKTTPSVVPAMPVAASRMGSVSFLAFVRSTLSRSYFVWRDRSSSAAPVLALLLVSCTAVVSPVVRLTRSLGLKGMPVTSSSALPLPLLSVSPVLLSLLAPLPELLLFLLLLLLPAARTLLSSSSASLLSRMSPITDCASE